MRRPLAVTALAALAVTLCASTPARAQYMYLDSNGDGIHSAADVLPTAGTATVDVWLASNRNKDGSVATCVTGSEPMTIGSYEFCLRAVDGRVAFSDFANHVALPVTLFASGTATEFFAAQFGPIALSEGLYRLASVSVAVTSGTPALQIVTDAPTLEHSSPTPPETAFGSVCGGINFNNTITLGIEWFDVDGLTSSAPSPGGAPALSPLVDMSVGVGDVVVQHLQATDPDSDPITFSLESGPSFLDVTTQEPGRGTASGSLYAVPHRDDLGAHAASVLASDGSLVGRGSLQVRVVEAVNHAPLASIPPRIAVVAGTRWRKTLVARDFDGQPLTIRKSSGPDFLSAGVVAQGEGGAVGYVSVGPSLCDAGEYDGLIAVSDGLAIATQPMHLSVRPAMPAPPADLITLVTGLFPAALAGGDLNEDGLMDLVAANEMRTLSVFIAQGGGSFAPEHAYAVAGYPSRPSSVVLADFNEDGHLDAAVGVTHANNLTIIFGRGDGTFSSGYTIPANVSPEALLAIDINDDGHVDVIVANGGASAISVFPGVGDGTFAARRDIAVPGTPYGLTAGDFNRDGRLDLAVAGAFFSTVSILLGHGDGTFHTPTALEAGRSPFGVVTGDWNLDGSLDLAAVDYNGSLFVYRGDGNGGFSRTAEFSGFTALQSITVGDLSSDGIDDLVVADVTGKMAQVFRGDGQGGFVKAETIDLPIGAYQCVIGDMDGDAVPDLAMSDENYGAVFVRRFSAPVDAAGFARAFVTGDHRPVISGSRTPSFCVRLEPVEGSFSVEDVDLASLRLVSEGTGSVEAIPAITSKGSTAGDRDHNGIVEVAVCFAGEDLSRLFDRVSGRSQVGARLEGRLSSGRFFCTRLLLDIQGSNQPLLASVAPNPLNPNGVLRFTTSQRGPLTVTIFDIQGRRVRTVASLREAPAGEQTFPIDGRTDTGSALASGVYFYRIDAAEGTSRGRFSLLK